MKTDVTIVGRSGDTVFAVRAETARARNWLAHNVDIPSGYALAYFPVEHRYIADLVQAMIDEGLSVC